MNLPPPSAAADGRRALGRRLAVPWWLAGWWLRRSGLLDNWGTGVVSKPWSTTVATIRHANRQVEHSVRLTRRFPSIDRGPSVTRKVSSSLAQSDTPMSGWGQDDVVRVFTLLGLRDLQPIIIHASQHEILSSCGMGMQPMGNAIGAEDHVVEAGLVVIGVELVEETHHDSLNAGSDDRGSSM